MVKVVKVISFFRGHSASDSCILPYFQKRSGWFHIYKEVFLEMQVEKEKNKYFRENLEKTQRFGTVFALNKSVNTSKCRPAKWGVENERED